MNRIVSVAIAVKADAIHPGFGFLSENSQFVLLCVCEKYNIVFIGPPASLIQKMGNKSMAKQAMKQAGVPVVPGIEDPVYDAEKALEEAKEIGFPIMIKAALGGGGKGMRIAANEQEFIPHFRIAQEESFNAFADNTMYLERYIQNPRHVEVQIAADKYGNIIHLGERDCSVQRRHQKMIEESPCAALSSKTRCEMLNMAVQAARAVGYESVGTIEFLLDHSGDFFFMEMNTRIQVEHPVSEMVSGIDLIKEQIRIAQWETLSICQKDILFNGHAIECRINAEDPVHNFMPCPDVVRELHLPGGNGVRIDTALYPGYRVPPYYDSMLAKVIVHDRDGEGALRKMISTLGELRIEGLKTNTEFQYDILNTPDFQEGTYTTDFISRYYGL
ncbi:Biotin carboxylase [Clostridium sp. C105KSO13]|nr:Biotin carboxylase [Clostridium sp. C105KSO13]